MEQYIKKSEIVAEIEKRKYQFISQAESFRKIGKEDKESYFAALASNMNSLSCFLDTLAKEVDLDAEFDKYCETLYLIDLENEPYAELFECAKHFFELGMQKAMKGE